MTAAADDEYLGVAVYCPQCGSRTSSVAQRLLRTVRTWSRPTMPSIDPAVVRYAVASIWLAVSLLITVRCGFWYVGVLDRGNKLPFLAHLKVLWDELPDLVGWSIGLTATWVPMVVLADWAHRPSPQRRRSR